MTDDYNLNSKSFWQLERILKDCIKHQEDQYLKVSGVLLGLVAGDRIGGPRQMALQLSGSLIERQGYNLENIGQSYFQWWLRAGFDTGPIAEHVFSLVQMGKSFEDASFNIHNKTNGMTAGCNPAHRSTPLAMSFHITNNQLVEYTMQEARLTHFHPIAGEAAVASNLLCRFLILGSSWEEALDLVKQKVQRDMRDHINKGLSGKSLQKGGYAPHVLEAALYFVHTSQSFDEMLERSIHFAGSANYCPVLAGSLGGARWGSKNISDHWFEGNKILKSVKLAAQNLAHGWSD